MTGTGDGKKSESAPAYDTVSRRSFHFPGKTSDKSNKHYRSKITHCAPDNTVGDARDVLEETCQLTELMSLKAGCLNQTLERYCIFANSTWFVNCLPLFAVRVG